MSREGQPSCPCSRPRAARDEASNASKRQCTSRPNEQTTTMIDSASAIIEFKVNFEQTKDVAAGKAISSDAISIGGHTWTINFYPRGVYERSGTNSEHHLSISLERRRSKFEITRNIKTIFEALLMDKDGKPLLVSTKLPQSLQRFWCNFGWLVSPTNLAKNYVKDGQIRFLCTITVLHDSSIAVPLLDSTDGMDVSFAVDGEIFHVHRAVLAAGSPVFKAQLLGSMAEATMPCVTLHDITPAAFKAMLRFMYTDLLPGEDDLGDSPTAMFEHLLVAADRFALDRLKLMCAQKLWENVTVDTVSEALACAETYNCPELKSKCIEFVVADKNFKGVALTESFMQLGQRFPSIIAEVREKIGI